MPALSGAQQTALEQRAVMRRIFVEIDALNADTGAAEPARFWDDVGTKVVDGKTFYGSGTLGEVATIAAASNLSITPLVMTLSGISPEVELAVRGTIVAQRPARLWFGIYDPATPQALIGSLLKMSEVYADDIDIKTPESGGLGLVTLTCESADRELTIRSTDTRSHDSQRARKSTDNLFIYTDAVTTQSLWFGPRTHRKHKKKNRR